MCAKTPSHVSGLYRLYITCSECLILLKSISIESLFTLYLQKWDSLPSVYLFHQFRSVCRELVWSATANWKFPLLFYCRVYLRKEIIVCLQNFNKCRFWTRYVAKCISRMVKCHMQICGYLEKKYWNIIFGFHGLHFGSNIFCCPSSRKVQPSFTFFLSI